LDVARAILGKYPDMVCVDIGANVGDSALLLRQLGPIPTLCVEGDRHFVRYLESNVHGLSGIEVAPVFIGRAGFVGKVVRRDGTGRLVADPSGEVIETIGLDELGRRFPFFASPRLVKIDTDGMDPEIILANMPWLADRKPVIFFEYDPRAAGLSEGAAANLWRSLGTHGYSTAIVYANTGEFVASIALSDNEGLNSLFHEYSDGEPGPYADICVLPTVDRDLGSPIEQAARDAPGHS